MCYKQKCKVVSLNLAHPVVYVQCWCIEMMLATRRRQWQRQRLTTWNRTSSATMTAEHVTQGN